jgi:hypothetical protein
MTRPEPAGASQWDYPLNSMASGDVGVMSPVSKRTPNQPSAMLPGGSTPSSYHGQHVTQWICLLTRADPSMVPTQVQPASPWTPSARWAYVANHNRYHGSPALPLLQAPASAPPPLSGARLTQSLYIILELQLSLLQVSPPWADSDWLPVGIAAGGRMGSVIMSMRFHGSNTFGNLGGGERDPTVVLPPLTGSGGSGGKGWIPFLPGVERWQRYGRFGTASSAPLTAAVLRC